MQFCRMNQPGDLFVNMQVGAEHRFDVIQFLSMELMRQLLCILCRMSRGPTTDHHCKSLSKKESTPYR